MGLRTVPWPKGRAQVGYAEIQSSDNQQYGHSDEHGGVCFSEGCAQLTMQHAAHPDAGKHNGRCSDSEHGHE